MIVKTDIEIWLLFAPFWILGLGALIGGIYHLVHGRRASHPDHHARQRHHYSRAVIAMAAFMILMIIGIGVAAALGYVMET